MSLQRLSILYVSQMPASAPRFGAQAPMHGLMTELARHHDLTAVMLVEEFDIEECRRTMQVYCHEVVLVPNPCGRQGGAKRRLPQLRSLVSSRSFDRMRVTVQALQQALDRVMRARRSDIVNLEFPYLGHFALRQAPPGEKPPLLVVDSHEIAYDLTRQFAVTRANLGRRLYAGANWRKPKREELGTVALAMVIACSLIAVPSIVYAGRPIGIDVARAQLIGATSAAVGSLWLQTTILVDHSSFKRIVLAASFCTGIYLVVVVGLFRLSGPIKVAHSVAQDLLAKP